MKTIQLKFGSTLSEIKEVAISEFGKIEGIYLSLFKDHYRGNSVGEIMPIEKDYPYDFNWNTEMFDRGIQKALLIKGNIDEILAERKKLTDKIKEAQSQSWVNRVTTRHILVDGRWKKARREAAIENNRTHHNEYEIANQEISQEIKDASDALKSSDFDCVSSRQYRIDT